EADEIRLVVMNLIHNAQEAIKGDRGIITCTTGSFMCDRAYLNESLLEDKPPEGPYVFLEVSDTGEGIDYPLRRHIVEPYFTTRRTGTGLGLAAVAEIVRSYRGALKLQTAPGLGSTFTVLFPALPRSAMHLLPPRPLPDEWRGQGTVLLVDDAKTCLAI